MTEVDERALRRRRRVERCAIIYACLAGVGVLVGVVCEAVWIGFYAYVYNRTVEHDYGVSRLAMSIHDGLGNLFWITAGVTFSWAVVWGILSAHAKSVVDKICPICGGNITRWDTAHIRTGQTRTAYREVERKEREPDTRYTHYYSDGSSTTTVVEGYTRRWKESEAVTEYETKWDRHTKCDKCGNEEVWPVTVWLAG